MGNRDLRDNIIPTVLENYDDQRQAGNDKFNTTDLIFIESRDIDVNMDDLVMKRIPCTDYAKMNNAFISGSFSLGGNSNKSYKWFRTPYYSYQVFYSGGYGQSVSNTNIGICPSLHYKIPCEEDYFENDFNICKNNETGYYTLNIGEYPKNKVNEELSNTLEKLYNNGDIKEEIKCTGRWFSNNGIRDRNYDYAGKHSPEFEYNGKKYVRVSSIPNSEKTVYSDGVEAGNSGTVRWVNVEPISFIIKNWDDMPKYINPDGNSSKDYFDLVSEDVIISGISFYPDSYGKNSNLWQNSTIRGFLNGIDVRNIKENGNPDFSAGRGGNFSDECNFLNEAFNLEREPIYEYKIPQSESIIPKDAFNGCVSLKKLILHPNIKKIGERAFDGIDFKYVCLDNNKNFVFVTELPEKSELYIDVIDLLQFSKSFDSLNYNLIIKAEDFNSFTKYVKEVGKSKLKISNAFVSEVIEKGNENLLYENNEFRFFKNEIQDINEKLCNFPDEEKNDFWKFAYNLGCFSNEKIKDKNGNEKRNNGSKSLQFFGKCLK